MRRLIPAVLAFSLMMWCGLPMQAQAPAGTWLDHPLDAWTIDPLPPSPAHTESAVSLARRCAIEPRQVTSAEQAVAAAGWTPFLHLDRELRAYGIEIVGGLSGADPTCGPSGFNLFVFVEGVFAGTLSPLPMSSGGDASAGAVRIIDAGTITAEFARYLAGDAACCPSSRVSVRFKVERGSAGPRVAPVELRVSRG